VIGVLYMKNLNPGPMIFVENPVSMYAIFIVFILANLLMLPLGYWCIKVSKRILKVPRNILMPLILLFCIVGAFAVNNSVYGILLMLGFGVLGFFMEEHDVPIAPCVLGIVLGKMLEESFVTSMIKSDGNLLGFFQRPISAGLGVVTVLVLLLPLWTWLRRSKSVPRTV